MGLQMGANWLRRLAEPILLCRQHRDELSSARDQGGQGLCVLVRQRSYRWVDHRSEVRQGLGIQGVGFRQRPRRFGEVAHVSRVDHHRDLGRRQRLRDRDFVPAGGFQHHQRWGYRAQPLDKPRTARLIIGNRELALWAKGHPSPFCFRRRPVHFGMASAVEAGEAVAGLPSGIGHRDKGDGGVVERTGGLVVEEMDFGHHGDRGYVPRRLVFFLARNLFDQMTALARGFIGLDAGIVRSKIDDIHCSPATGLGASQMLMLQGLDETTMLFTFLI